jgi:ElaB/YqjD/DUF883 family membrane-anchored ribosome-binding protein
MLSTNNDNQSQPPVAEGASAVLARVEDYLAEADAVVRDLVRNQPAAALGIALFAGVVLGWLIKRR